MYKIIDIKPENKDIVVVDTITNTTKKYLSPSELRPLYERNPSMCENFKFDGRGFRYLPNGQQTVNLDDIRAELERIDMHLSKLNNTTHENFMVLDTNTDKNIDKVLQDLTKAMGGLCELLTKKTEELNIKIDNVTSLLQNNHDAVYNKLRELGMTMEEFEDKFDEITTQLLKNTDKNNKFPHIDNADKYNSFMPKSLLEITDNDTIASLLTASVDDDFLKLDKGTIERKDKNGKSYFVPENYQFLNLLRGHLKQMNDASINIENQFMCDVDSQKHTRTNDNISSILILGTSVMATSAAAVFFGPAVVLLQNVAANAFTVTSLTLFKKAKNVSFTNMDSLRRHNHEGNLHNKVASYNSNIESEKHMGAISDEITTSNVQLLKIKDVPLLQSDVESYNYYVADIRNFRILTLSCVYKRHSIFHHTLSKENRKYEKYLRGSLFEDKDFSDKSLFNFYCAYYLESEIDNSNNIATQSEIDLRKTLMLAFINAYFAAKVLYIPFCMQRKTTIHIDYNNLKETDRMYLRMFLMAIKYGLLLQNVRVDTANKLLQGF